MPLDPTPLRALCHVLARHGSAPTTHTRPHHHHIEHPFPPNHHVTCLLFLRVVSTDSARDLLLLLLILFLVFHPSCFSPTPFPRLPRRFTTPVFRFETYRDSNKNDFENVFEKVFYFFFVLGRPWPVYIINPRYNQTSRIAFRKKIINWFNKNYTTAAKFLLMT